VEVYVVELRRLFSPIEVGGGTVKNRIVMAPMGANFENVDGSVSESLLDYFEARARGGVGLIISPFTMVSREQRAATLAVYSDRFVPGLNRLCERVKQHGARFLLQIAHPGAKVMDTLTGRQPVAPSAFKSPIYWHVPRELTEEEIEELVDEFGQAALRARAAGFDGVEVHGAHTYLIGQFISPHCNRRDDRYGGDFERRMAFPSEIVRRVRELCGGGFIIGFKFSGHEELEGGVDAPLARRIAAHMEQAGVHYVHVASTSSIPNLLEVTSEYPSDPSIYSPPGVLVRLAEQVKEAVDVPVIGTGAISDPQYAEEILRAERVDMVATGRAQIADPEWSENARRGKPIRFCIKCNICHKRLYGKQRLKCSVNPVVGEEQRYERRAAPRRKKVAVVGAGPAGMEAALTAGTRGHEVVLYEAGSQVGGNMIPGSIPSFKGEIGQLLRYYERSLAASGIDLRLGARIEGPDELAGHRPDTVVWAVGAELAPPEAEIRRGHGMRTVLQLYQGDPESIGEEVLVIGAGFVGCETGWYLSSLGKEVRIVDAIGEEELLSDEHPTNRTTLLKSLEREGVEVLCDREVVQIGERGVSVRRSDGAEEELQAQEVVIATGFRPRRDTEHWRESLAAMEPEIEFVPVGDCVSPGNLYDAIRAGFLAGWEV
jgi:2,4-dienoyl-CoA reductase-like NADH-dependent reductase (Old Yellow Enzyme family)/thioredoxin reductase